KGEKGEQGERGFRGNRGPVGPEGPQGPQGDKGVDGTVEFTELTEEQIEMIRGPEGPEGPEGPQGTEGPEGPKSADCTVEFTELTEEQIEMTRGAASHEQQEVQQGPQVNEGPKGETGMQGPQGPTGEVTTEQLLETREIVESKINDISVNVKDYGVTGDGTTDDTESLIHAISEIEKMGTDKVILIPKGDYLINERVNVKNSLEGSQATLRYNGVGTALVVGDNSQAGLFTNRQYYKLPRVINRSRGSDGWDRTSVGVECVNLNTCEITV